MKPSDYTLDSISTLISSEVPFDILSDLIKDMDLEIIDVRTA